LDEIHDWVALEGAKNIPDSFKFLHTTTLTARIYQVFEKVNYDLDNGSMKLVLLPCHDIITLFYG